MNRPPRFPDVDWYCDHCEAHLNNQPGFDDHKYIWKCSKCGGKSSISRDNIKKPNYAAIKSTLHVLEVLRTLSMHCGLMALLMLITGTAIDELPKFLIHPAIAYPILLMIMLLVIVAGHFRGVGFIATICDTLWKDVGRPCRELLKFGNFFHAIRIHSKMHTILFSSLKLLIYSAIIAAEVWLVVCTTANKWGSFAGAIGAGREWLSSIENLKQLYIPFLIFSGAMIIVTFLAFGIDKYYACNKKWRIKEATLLMLSVLWGAIGGILGMLIFHHKTRKPGFRIIVPILAACHITIIVYASIQFFS